MRSGDWGNLFILANSGLFLASVILQNAGVVDWHSVSFVEDGREDYLQVNERAERNERAEDRSDTRRYTVRFNPRHAPVTVRVTRTAAIQI
jgi:hypothetical protein